jgi:hypothetical protein
MSRNDETRDRAEAATTETLRAHGYDVTNLNDLAGNFPAADLAARRTGERLLIQVRGTTTLAGKFAAPPTKARTLCALADALDCHGLYAFVQFAKSQQQVILFETAAQVAVLAEEDETAYDGVNRYHVNVGQFDVTADRIAELLAPPR